MTARSALALLALTSACGNAPRDRLQPPPLDPADVDRDGFESVEAGGDDCDDRDPLVHPGAPDTCNGVDDDCQAGTDQGFSCILGADEPCGLVPGFTRRCGEDCTWGSCEPLGGAEACTGASECRFGDTVTCPTPCGEGTRTCTAGCVFGPCAPPAESCNGLDDDCDGKVDEATFGIAGPTRALPWAGYWVDAIAGTATDEGFAFVYGSAADRLLLAPDFPVVLTWTDAEGEPRGDPVRLDDPEEPGAAEIAVVWTGTEVAAAWEAGNLDVPAPTFVAFAGRDGVRVRSAIAPSMWAPDSPRIAWTGDALVIVLGRNMSVVSADGAVLAESVALPEEAAVALGGAYPIAWDDGVVFPGEGALLWLGLDGTVLRSVPVDGVDATTAVHVDPDGISLATSERLIRLDRRGVEVWRTEADGPAPHGAVVRLGDEHLAVSLDQRGLPQPLIGWKVDAEGASVDPPRIWAGDPMSTVVVSNGETAFVAMTPPASIAPLGCARP